MSHIRDSHTATSKDCINDCLSNERGPMHSYTRNLRHMDPLTLEMLLMRRINKDLWSEKYPQDRIDEKKAATREQTKALELEGAEQNDIRDVAQHSVCVTYCSNFGVRSNADIFWSTFNA